MAAALAIALGAVMMTASTASAASFTITKKTSRPGIRRRSTSRGRASSRATPTRPWARVSSR
jgi:hypothetical protein